MTVELSGGALVAIDTETLREASAGWRMLADRVIDVLRLLQQALAPLQAMGAGGSLLQVVTTDVTTALAGADGHASDLAAVALQYEIVEAQAALAAARLGGDEALIARLEARLTALEQQAARPLALAGAWGFAYGGSLVDVITRVAAGAGPLALPVLAAGWGLLAGIHTAGRGRVHAGERLAGDMPAVEVQRVAEHEGTAPTAVGDLMDRMPGDEDSRIRIEKHTMPDGETAFVVYITGTQWWGLPGAEPHDILSNLELYFGSHAASYAAIVAALEDAGVTPDDALHVVGHSQGAMGASRLALEGDYNVETLVTAGNPVQVDVPDDVLTVAMQHSDDPVAALADGGFGHVVGQEGSFIARRDTGSLNPFGSHMVDAYRET
ncbi:hypothetical protein, partial [Microbacterium sp.]|uniref:hypothetical protein n=1 Tax=Microbacterium sp. TaxID=51671 RepID=UPI003A85A876